MRWHVAVLTLLCSSCRCGEPARPLDVTVLGATALERTTTDRFFFDAPDAPTLAHVGELTLEWSPGGAAKIAQTRTDNGRTLTTLERPGDGARALEVRAGASRRTLSFVFRPSTSGLVESLSARARDDLSAARAELEALPADQWPWGCVGVARAVPHRERPDAYAACADGARARGFVTEAISRRIAALYWARRLRQYSRARALIEALQRSLAELPDARLASQFHYQQAVFLAETGDLRGAEAALHEAIDEAVEAQRTDEATLYRAYAAVVLSEAGRHAAALKQAAELEGLDAPSLSQADRFAIRSNLSWVRLRALLHHAAPASLADPSRAELERLSDELVEAGETLDASNTLANLAWLELAQGRLDDARVHLARARTYAGTVPTVEAVFLDWLAGRLALASNDAAGAVRAFESMLQLAALTAERAPDSAWRAQLGLAEARLLQNRGPDAVRALEAARAALSTQARAFVDPTQRVLFLDDRRRAIADAVDSFARAGRCELAWRLADDGQTWLARSLEADRRVRLLKLAPEARAAFERDEEQWASEREAVLAEAAPPLASTEELETWKAKRAVTLEALRVTGAQLAERLTTLTPVTAQTSFAPASLQRDEALLELFRTGSTQRAFLVRKSGVTCGADAAELVSEQLLSGVRHLFVVDGGARVSSALVRRVLEQRTLSFVPSAAWLTQPRAEARGTPLVIGDPRRDLPAARAEARSVARSLNAELLEGDAATLDAMLGSWGDRAVLHFAGHGRLSPSAPWDARLDLARGQSLDFELLLARRPGPGLVVLSGCETGTAHDAPADGIGLAEGFLAGGASHVLATTAEVRDEAARGFIERFYRLGGVSDPASAFRLAALEADAAGETSWKDWKLLGHRAAARQD